MAVGAWPCPGLADAAGCPGGLADCPGGRLAVQADYGAAVVRGDVDTLPVRADRHGQRAGEPTAVSTGARPSLTNAAVDPGGLTDRPGGRVAVQAGYGTPVRGGDVNAFTVRAHRHRAGRFESVAVGAGARPRLAHAAGDPGGLTDRPGGRVADKTRHTAHRS